METRQRHEGDKIKTGRPDRPEGYKYLAYCES